MTGKREPSWTFPRRPEAWPWHWIFLGTYLPSMGQAADGRVAEAKHDRKERVEILLLLEAVSTRPRHPQRKQPCPQCCLRRVGGLGSKGSWGRGNKEKADWATQWAGKGVKKGQPQGWQHRATVSTHPIIPLYPIISPHSTLSQQALTGPPA